LNSRYIKKENRKRRKISIGTRMSTTTQQRGIINALLALCRIEIVSKYEMRREEDEVKEGKRKREIKREEIFQNISIP
jgi:hypothetical protein